MELPLNRKEMKFVEWFRKYRDIYQAAAKAGIAKNQAKRTYERLEIQEEIERQDGVVERERAKVQVEAEGISRSFLDVELLQVIKLDAKKHTAGKLRGIELGYVRAGVLQVGSTRSLDLTPPNPDDEAPMPTVYSAIIGSGVRVDVSPLVPDKPQQAAPTQSTPAPQPQAPRAGKLKLG